MKSFAIYAAMVGIPIAVLIPVMRVGRTIVAPPAVAGDWRSGGGISARITQSGRYVEVVLRDSGAPRGTLKGRVEDTRLTAASRSLPCGPGEATLTLELEPGIRPDSAWGGVASPAAACALPVLRLRRVPSPGRRSGR